MLKLNHRMQKAWRKLQEQIGEEGAQSNDWELEKVKGKRKEMKFKN